MPKLDRLQTFPCLKNQTHLYTYTLYEIEQTFLIEFFFSLFV